MFARIMLTALAAGLIAGVFLWAGHMVKTTPLILAAEVYEQSGETGGHDHAAHSHQTADAPEKSGEALPKEVEEWAPADGLERAAFTLLADVLTSIGFAFLLSGAVSLFGREVDWRRGILWGLCGFAAFFAAPSLGLPPELPGMQAADLAGRQTWWLATAAATAAGLGMLILSPAGYMKAIGVVLIVLPHVIGAPSHDIAYGATVGRVPAELAAQFTMAVFVVTGLFWILLGGLTGYFYNRFEES